MLASRAIVYREKKMAQILSMQSHVVYGHAGNAAAVFPIQRLGHQAMPLNLLQFSNHTGYGEWGGKAISAQELEEVFNGLKKINIFKQIDGLITGYIGSAEQASVLGKFIQEIKTQNPNALYCCDPVIGDEHTGTYTKPEVENAIKTHLIKHADIVTPNKYELSKLTNTEITDLNSALTACELLQYQGPQTILATSIAKNTNNTGLLLNTGKEIHHVETPKYELDYTVRGTGDATAAMFLSHCLSKKQPAQALEQTANAIHAITKYTNEHKLSELAIIQCQQAIANPKIIYKTKELMTT